MKNVGAADASTPEIPNRKVEKTTIGLLPTLSARTQGIWPRTRLPKKKIDDVNSAGWSHLSSDSRWNWKGV